jgi:hypothetical protein
MVGYLTKSPGAARNPSCMPKTLSLSWALSSDRGRNRRSFDCKHVPRFRAQGRDQYYYYCVVKPIHMLSICLSIYKAI